MDKEQLKELDKMEKDGNLWKKCDRKDDGQFCGFLSRKEKVNICLNRESCRIDKQSFLSKADYIEAVEYIE